MQETSLRAGVDSAANGGGGLPHDLGEVTIALKLLAEVVRGRLAILAGEVRHLIIVVETGDNSGEVSNASAGSNVLAIATTINVPVTGQ
jgi:hypothetical protein